MDKNKGFQFRHFFVSHDECALKVGTDGVLIGAWACSIVNSSDIFRIKKRHNTVLDIGTGTGLIALMAAQEIHSSAVTAIDIDLPSIGQAQKNVKNSPFSDRIKVLYQDFSDTDGLIRNLGNKFDTIISNPPFYEEDNICSDSRFSNAKHTSRLSFESLAKGVSMCLDNNGTFFVILPYSARSRFVAICAEQCLYLTHECTVYPTEKLYKRNQPQRSLLAFSRIIQPTLHSELTILNSKGNQTQQYQLLTELFYSDIGKDQ